MTSVEPDEDGRRTDHRRDKARNDGPLLRRRDPSKYLELHHAADDSRQCRSSMIGKGAVPGDPPTDLPHFGGADRSDPTRDSWPTERHRRHDRRQGHAWCDPRGSWTGSCRSESVTSVQNAIPAEDLDL